MTTTSSTVLSLRQLLAEMELWATDPTAAIDQANEQFYRETGYMAPGKSVPLEMAATQHDDERQRRYAEWHLQRRELRHNTIREAADRLAALSETPPQESSEIADMEAEHARQSRDAYDAGVRDGHEQGFEEGKRWEP